MSVNSGYNELAEEVDYYQTAFELLKIHRRLNGGYSWIMSGKGDAQEINITTGSSRKLHAKEVGILAIAFSRGSEKTQIERINTQAELLNLGIVNPNDAIDMLRHLALGVHHDHLRNPQFRMTAIESVAKICLLVRAYEKLHIHLLENQEDILDPEYIMLIAYIISIFAHQYELRPYMVNKKFTREVDWVQVYDGIFNNFSNESRQFYADKGYLVLWELFHSIRDEIYRKKSAKREALLTLDAAKRVSSGVIKDIKTVFSLNESPLSNP